MTFGPKNMHPMQRRFFESTEPEKLGVAMHAFLMEDATLTEDQIQMIARHDAMERSDQLITYTVAAGLDRTEVIIVGDSHVGDACPYLGMDCGVGRDVIVVLGGDQMQYDRRLLALEPRMFKIEPRMFREVEPPAVVPRKGKKRDWEQRNRKQKRR